MVKIWASSIKAIPHDRLQLVSAVLDDRPQLMFKCYFREEAKILEQGNAKGLAFFPRMQILGEDTYTDPHAQYFYDEQILSLCNKATFKTGFKNNKKNELNHLPWLSRVRKNPLVTFYKG